MKRQLTALRLTVMTLLAALFAPATLRGAEPAPVVVSITDDTGCEVIIPDALMERLMPVTIQPDEPQEAEPSTTAPARRKGTTAGFRVQVFSDNNARTARNEARAKEQQIASAFPQWRTYKRYSAPYWRLRVGDFRSRREADEAAATLRSAFPAFGKDIRVVSDRVNVAE